MPSALGDGRPESPVVPVIDSATLRFEPAFDATAWILTVSGPGRFYERRKFEGAVPQLELLGAEGEALVDGPYSWELRTAGNASVDAVHWGHFTVRQGIPVVADAKVERPRRRAQVAPAIDPVPQAPTHASDVYIDGHLCVGGGGAQDLCTGAEPLALRTILMRDDNVRMRFEDTSDPANTFASTDWQLSSNDSFSGGSDYFAIQDLGDTGSTTSSPLRIDAGAGDNAIYVDSSGEVGLGTATPGARLHVMGNAVVEGDFSAGSSRDIKHGFAPVETRSILAKLVALPISAWSYRADQPGVRHLGPVAEDFHAAFSLGRDGRHVSPIDLSGVAFAAIQGLHEIVRAREAEIEELQQTRRELVSRIEALERGEARRARPRLGGIGW